jgi:hypothetical protein
MTGVWQAGRAKKVKLRTKDGEAKSVGDPTLVACAYNRQRFFLFSRREPEDNPEAAEGRCAWERPTSRAIAPASRASHFNLLALVSKKKGHCFLPM